MLTPSSTDAEYVQAYAKDWSTAQHEADRIVGRPPLLREHAVAAVADHFGSRCVLDVGCGSGDLAALLLKMDPTRRVDVWDVCQEAVDWTCRRLEHAGLERPLGVAGMFGPPPDGTRGAYDLVTSCETIEHVKSPRAHIEAMAAWSRAGVVITTPVGHCYPDPLHLHHWATAEDLCSELRPDLWARSWWTIEIPSAVGDGGRCFLMVGVVK